jgi:alkane 1-monooxygenase
MKSLKYLVAYITPLCVGIGFHFGDVFAFLTPFFTFVLVPIFDPFFPNSTQNLSSGEAAKRSSEFMFDLLLYLNVAVVYGSVYLFTQLENIPFFELVGHMVSLGILFGACGINVAHELGHRVRKYERFFALLLLLPSHYLHFYVEHNRGHHKNVATPSDPVTARLNESVYTFWFRAIFMSYVHAWQLEARRLSKSKKHWLNLHNQMIQFMVLHMVYLALLFLFLPTTTALILCFAGIIGLLLLETIDYIEHYGLLRKQKPDGRYKRTSPAHSWNSNRLLGRLLLYELTRHSDHHYLANKKYQILDHHDESPELPMGYPASMMLSLIPPLWFKVMNTRIPA